MFCFGSLQKNWGKKTFFFRRSLTLLSSRFKKLSVICSTCLWKIFQTLNKIIFRGYNDQCCQLSDFSDPFSDKSSDFWKNLSNFPMSPVLSCEHEILSYTSPCVCSDRWPLAPAERSCTFQWLHGSWHRCQWAAHVHTVLPRTNHLPASPLFEIKLFNLTVFLLLFFISCTYITHCHRALVHSSFWTPLRSFTGLCLRDCTLLYLLIHNSKLN